MDGGGAEHQDPGQEKSQRKQEKRRAVRDGELGDRKGRAPEQAERRHQER
jgi:hypothetical protein